MASVTGDQHTWRALTQLLLIRLMPACNGRRLAMRTRGRQLHQRLRFQVKVNPTSPARGLFPQLFCCRSAVTNQVADIKITSAVLCKGGSRRQSPKKNIQPPLSDTLCDIPRQPEHNSAPGAAASGALDLQGSWSTSEGRGQMRRSPGRRYTHCFMKAAYLVLP